MPANEIKNTCPECGSTVFDDEKFCKECGAHLKRTSEQAFLVTSSSSKGGESLSDLARRLELLENRVNSLDMRIPRSDIISLSFWKRSWAVFGHSLVATLIIYAILFGISLFLVLMGTGLTLIQK